MIRMALSERKLGKVGRDLGFEERAHTFYLQEMKKSIPYNLRSATSWALSKADNLKRGLRLYA
jgi:hypothetical protein